MDGSRSPSPMAAPPRLLPLMMSNSEQIDLDLDNLVMDDDEFGELVNCIHDSDAGAREVSIIAQEYWRRGQLGRARSIAEAGIQKFLIARNVQELPALYYLQANVSLSFARQSPKLVLPRDEVEKDSLPSSVTQAEHLGEAAGHLNAASKAAGGLGGSTEILGYLTRGGHQLANRQLEEALRSFEAVLSKSPYSIVALIGKSRILYAKRQYRESLRILQTVLQLRPTCRPDPRVGIGLCFWALDEKDKARKAWERSLEVDPNNDEANLLLGLLAVNDSKAFQEGTVESRQESFVKGSRYLQAVLKRVPYTSQGAAAASAVSEILQRQGRFEQALKAAERSIQFADTLTILSDAHIRAARASHNLGFHEKAMKHFSAAAEGAPSKVLAWLGRAQMHLYKDELPAAMHSLDTLLIHRGECLEAASMLGAICAYPSPAYSASELLSYRKKARDLFDRVCRIAPSSRTPSLASLADDPEMQLDIARLWQSESIDRAGKAYAEAIRLFTKLLRGVSMDGKLHNNVAVIKHLEGDLDSARISYQDALMILHTKGAEAEGAATTTLYNFARCWEEMGDVDKARDAFDKILTRHPEYVDAKIAKARMLVHMNRQDEAHLWIKQALEAEPQNPNTRAFYTWFFYQCGRPKEGGDFTSTSLKMNSTDVYNLCAYGVFMHNVAREGRSRTDEAQVERVKTFTRAASSFINALIHDPSCAVAAQGLAMIVVEDLLDTWAPGKAVNDSKARNNAREALMTFTKIKESLNDSNVFVNMGHCYHVRDDFERAIESYETGLNRAQGSSSSSILLYLCRSWYAKANKDKSFAAMKIALRYAQSAYHLSPSDKSILYNIAMIEQKSLEMMVSIEDLSRRTLADLEKAVEHARHAQALFNSLATDESKVLPYSKDIADQRRKYGETMLRKADAQLVKQQEFEAQSVAQIEEAQKIREEENERQQAQLAAALEAKRAHEVKLREQRQRAREEVVQWNQQFKEASDSDDERKNKRKPAAKKAKTEGGTSGDEVAPKKKRGPRRKKNVDTDGDEPMNGEGSDEDAPRPKKSRTKKRIVKDEEDEDNTHKRRKTEYKSKETISDSDEDLE